MAEEKTNKAPEEEATKKSATLKPLNGMIKGKEPIGEVDGNKGNNANIGQKCPLNIEKVRSALEALIKYVNAENPIVEKGCPAISTKKDGNASEGPTPDASEKKPPEANAAEPLFGNSERIFLQVNFAEILTQGRLFPYRVPQKATFLENGSNVVIFVKKGAQELGRRLGAGRELDFPYDFNVIDIVQLKSYYHSHVARASLSVSADMFLAENQILSLLQKLLGSRFIKRKRMPLSIRVDKEHIKSDLEAAFSSTPLTITASRCCQIRVGHSKLKTDDIAENIRMALGFIAEQFPGGWGNIQRAAVKTAMSPSLPILRQDPSFKNKADLRALDALKKRQVRADEAIKAFIASENFVDCGSQQERAEGGGEGDPKLLHEAEKADAGPKKGVASQKVEKSVKRAYLKCGEKLSGEKETEDAPERMVKKAKEVCVGAGKKN